MSVIKSSVASFLDDQSVGAIGTVGDSGRPRQSIVYFVRVGDRILISTEGDRLKARDVERTGWASLCVHGGEAPFPSATVAGPARIRTEEIGADNALVIQKITGATEVPEPLTDEALAAVGRVLLEIEVERVGPVTYID